MDFCDGAIAKQSQIFSKKESMQILFYYDDLEICNPLGSRKKVHKLG